jgi:hypothetical protein
MSGLNIHRVPNKLNGIKIYKPFLGGRAFLFLNFKPYIIGDACCRIGRVGRAERMGLAISLVSAVPEKVMLISPAIILSFIHLEVSLFIPRNPDLLSQNVIVQY